MENIFKKTLNKIDIMLMKLSFMLKNAFSAIRKKTAEKTGAFGEQGTWIVIIVVIAGIILLWLSPFIQTKLFPKVEEKVEGFFNQT